MSSRYEPPPTRRAVVYRLAMESGLPAADVGGVLDWSPTSTPEARVRVFAAASRCSIELPSRDGSLARAAARRELHTNRDAAPPRGGRGAA